MANNLIIMVMYCVFALFYYCICAVFKPKWKNPFFKAMWFTSFFGIFMLQMNLFFSIVCRLLSINPRIVSDKILMIYISIWMSSLALGLMGYLFVTITLNRPDGIVERKK